MPVINNNQKEYERAKTGTYVGVIAEVVDLGIVVDPVYGNKAMVLIIWVLNKNDSEGNPFTVAQRLNQSLHEKSNLYKVVKKVTGQPPVAPFNTDSLVGKSKQLLVVTENGKQDKLVSYIETILPLEDKAPLTVPANYVYTKDRKKSSFAGNPGQTSQNQSSQAKPQQTAAPAAAMTATAVADAEIPF